MLSREIQFFIDMLTKEKKENRGKVLNAEETLVVRKSIDDKIGGYTDDNVKIDYVENDLTSGEFYNLKSDKLTDKVILFIHGGGFSIGSVDSRRKLCIDIIKASNMDAFSVEYNQWPEAVHPQGLMDTVNAFKYLIHKGYKPENIYFFGESAGAMLVITSTLYLKENNYPLPGKLCVFSPVAGQNLDLPSHHERDVRDPMITIENVVPYYEGSDYNSPLVSPIYGDYKDFPPLYIHVGTEEVLYDDAVEIYKKCMSAGVNVKFKEWTDLFHVFILFPSPESDIAIEDIASFFRE